MSVAAAWVSDPVRQRADINADRAHLVTESAVADDRPECIVLRTLYRSIVREMS